MLKQLMKLLKERNTTSVTFFFLCSSCTDCGQQERHTKNKFIDWSQVHTTVSTMSLLTLTTSVSITSNDRT